MLRQRGDFGEADKKDGPGVSAAASAGPWWIRKGHLSSPSEPDRRLHGQNQNAWIFSIVRGKPWRRVRKAKPPLAASVSLPRPIHIHCSRFLSCLLFPMFVNKINCFAIEFDFLSFVCYIFLKKVILQINSELKKSSPKILLGCPKISNRRGSQKWGEAQK